MISPLDYSKSSSRVQERGRKQPHKPTDFIYIRPEQNLDKAASVLYLRVHHKAPSSSGLGHWPLTPATGVRVPLGSPAILVGYSLQKDLTLPGVGFLKAFCFSASEFSPGSDAKTSLELSCKEPISRCRLYRMRVFARRENRSASLV
jgi:hypothetical protein